jgi:hypothetical protein
MLPSHGVYPARSSAVVSPVVRFSCRLTLSAFSRINRGGLLVLLDVNGDAPSRFLETDGSFVPDGSGSGPIVWKEPAACVLKTQFAGSHARLLLEK